MRERILAEFEGSQLKLAEALGVTKGAVSQWFSEGVIPPARAIQIEQITDGALKAVEITEGFNNGRVSAN
ncbi:MAG: Cro/CI family transcriptional regulator [Shewanella sp.]